MKRIQIVFLILLCIGCVILPIISIDGTRSLYNEKRIFEIGILLILTILVIFTNEKEIILSRANYSKYFLVSTVFIFTLSVTSAFSSSIPFYALTELCLLLLLIALVGYIGLVTNHHTFIVWIIFGTACIYVLLYSIKFGIQYYFHVNEYVSFWLWPGGVASNQLVGYSNIRFFNQVQAFTLPLIIGSALILLKKRKKIGILLLSLPVIWWMLLVQSAGRGIILSMFTAALIVLMLFKSKTHEWIWYFLGTLAIGYVAKVVLFEVIPDPEQVKSIVRGGSGRLELWPKLFLDTLNRPLLGHGPMSFADINTGYFRGHPHNSVLQLLYEFGYPVTIAIVCGIFYGIKRWTYQTRKVLQKQNYITNYTIVRISLTVAFLCGLIYSLFSGVIVMPLSQLWLAMVTGTMVGLYVREKGIDNFTYINKWKTYLFKSVVVLAAGVLLSVGILDVPNFRENRKKYLKVSPRATSYPRFWQQGKIGLDTYKNSKEIKNNSD